MSTHNEKIEAYLSRNMSPAERAAFEAALKTDPVLQKNYVLRSLKSRPVPSENEQAVRQMVEGIRQRMEPLEPPTITWLDRLQFSFSSLGGKILAVAGIGLLAFLAWVNFSLPSLPELAQAHFVKPPCLETSGAKTETAQNYAVFYEASRIFCPDGDAQTKRESLQTLAKNCSGFCMAHYFLAHLDFENGRFGEAVAGFDECLKNRAFVTQFSQTTDFGIVKLNRLLAEMSADGDGSAALAKIQELKNDPDCKGDVLESLEELQGELTSPLRKFKF